MFPFLSQCIVYAQLSTISTILHSIHRGPGSEAACAPEAASATHALGQLLDDDYFRHHNLLDDQLRDAVAFFDLEVCVAEIGKDHADLAAVVGVDDAGHCVDTVFGGEAGAGGDTAIC